MNDELAIRELQQAWLRATIDGDVSSVSELMTDDVVFLTPGRQPFGKEEFISAFIAMKDKVSMDCNGEFEEILVSGDFAYARARIEVQVLPKGGHAGTQMAGYTMTVLRRSSTGAWQICRDANLLSPKT